MFADTDDAFDQESEKADLSDDGSENTNQNSKRTKTENKKAKKKRKNEMFKPPTNEEMNRLRETENLFNSSLFRMQIDEMLNEITLKQKRIDEFRKWLKQFDTFFKTIPEYADLRVSELTKKAEKSKNKLINNLLENNFNYVQTDQDLQLKFLKPETYTTFGLHKIQCSLKNNTDFNINVTMPKGLFNAKDYLNNRYLVRRYYYLLYIATCLKKSKICTSICIGHLDGNELLPMLIITPKDSFKIKVQITLIPPQNYFKTERFLMDKNNVKSLVFSNVDSLLLENFNEKPTIFYNATMLRDVTMSSLNGKIENHLTDLKNVQDGIKLLIVWLTQRNLNSGLVSFHNNYILYVVTYLLLKKKINKMMSSYQVVRIFWNFVATTNWSSEPVSLIQDIKQSDLKIFQEHYAVSFVDFSGHYNLIAFLSLEIYEKLRAESKLAVEYLDNNRINSFDALFMVKMPISQQFDAILSLQDDENFRSVSAMATDEEKFRYMGFHKEMVVHVLLKHLKQGLGKRTTHIVPFYCMKETVWEMGRLQEENDFNKILFGINLNPDTAFSPIELGPEEFDENAEQFRTFWGDLCELRRFADNKICEAVYIKCDTVQERRQVFKKLINYIVSKKLSLKFKLISDEFEVMLKMKNFVLPFKTETNEEVNHKIKNSFEKLREKLRSIKIQLGVTGVQGSSDVFSFTDPFPAVPTNYKCGKKITTEIGDNIVFKTDVKIGIVPRHISPIECVFQLARDSKWPNQVNALRCVITEFYFEISKLLQEFNIKSKVKTDHLDVLYEGLVFRLRMYQPKEILLLKKYINDEGLTAYKDTEESIELERKLNIVPSLTSALNGLALQCPSYGPSTCLIKRWLRSQLIDDYHFPDMAINLLNASLFIQSAPYEAAQLPQIAFLRFLKFFAEFRLENQPIVINFNEKLTVEELTDIQSDFQQNRSKYPPLFIISPYDDMKSIFTASNPTTAILKRVAILALETYKYADNCVMGRGQLHVEELFIPNMQGYNAIIHLNVPTVARRYQYSLAKTLSTEIEDYDETFDSKIPIVDFDPVQSYLTVLRKNYSKFALFFYDTYGGTQIGVLWKPDVFKEKEFKVIHSHCRKITNGKLTFNENAAIEDFYILGNGIVKTVDVN